MLQRVITRGAKLCGLRTRSGNLACSRCPLTSTATLELQVFALQNTRRRFSTESPPPPFAETRDGDADTGVLTAVPQPVAPFGVKPQQSDEQTAAPAPFSPGEVKALVLPLIPLAPRALQNRSAQKGNPDGLPLMSITVSSLQRQLPKALRHQMNRYERLASAAAALKCDIWNYTKDETSDAVYKAAARLMSNGLGAYLADHFPDELVVVMPGGRLLRKDSKVVSPNQTTGGGDTICKENTSFPMVHKGTAPSSFDTTAVNGAADSANNVTLEAASPNTKAGKKFTGNSSAGIRSFASCTTPPPPPQPVGPIQRYGGSAGAAGFFSSGGGSAVGMTGALLSSTTASLSAAAANAGATTQDTHGDAAVTAVPLRTTIQVVDVLVEYIPTFYVSVDDVHPLLPSNVQQLYSDTSLRFFLKRFKHYIDMRTQYSATEVRLRVNFDHPRRGVADGRYRTGSTGTVESLQHSNQLRRPPRNSEANLIGVIAPRMPKTFTPLAEVLQEIAPIVSRHPAFDSRLGVTGLLGKYPEYFQLVDGQLRARPYRVAPNSLKDFDRVTSPLPKVFAKVVACVEEAAEGKNYAEPAGKTAATVSTGRLYSLLNANEKMEVKQKCRSFPTFLRLHGKDLVVSVDKMRVYKFIPEHEACVDTLLDERLRMNSLDPNDPILKIPAEMAPESNAEWAVRELYDALPLMQCAELDEVLSLVPPAVRDALPKDVSEVRALLQGYSDYFTIWPYPDDESVIVVQRAKVEQPVLDKADIARMVVPLIPQGGTTLTSLRTRAPLHLQRYFYLHGTVATLGAMKDMFAIAGERIVRLA